MAIATFRWRRLRRVRSIGEPLNQRLNSAASIPAIVGIRLDGLTPPWRQDGVPGISGPPIPSGGSADYDFPLAFGGTFWMHSHQGLQEQGLMTAPLIIHDARDRPDEQEVVVMLADFSFTPAEQIFENQAQMRGTSGLIVEREWRVFGREVNLA